jgi:hypothetical protein
MNIASTTKDGRTRESGFLFDDDLLRQFVQGLSMLAHDCLHW